MITIRKAGPEDAATVFRMARQLAEEIGDGEAFSCSPETLYQYGFGPGAVFHNLVAEAAGEYYGLAMYSPVFSTNLGAPGVYVSDLWVAAGQRQQQLGRRLLAATARQAHQDWGAAYMTLLAYEDNPAALRFYQRLGFSEKARDKRQMLSVEGFQALLG